MANVELYKVRVESDDGTKAFYPHTSTNVVFNSAGKNVDELLSEKSNSNHTHDDRYYTETEMDAKLSAKLETNGNASNVTNTFTQSSSLTNLTTGEKLSASLGKVMKAIADLISHIGNKTNPHGVTKAQVGLGNVDNTSDANKPISTAVQNALNGKSPTNHNHDTAYSKITDGSGALYKGPMTPQENLILNSDFACGIINQKGKSSYNVNGIYTIDMWRLVGSGSFGGKVTVGTNDILIENNGTEDVFFVNKTDLSYLIDRDYLVYVNAIGLGNNNAYVYCDAESGKVGRTQLTQGENFIPIKGKPVTIGFELASTTRLRINKVKLEKGSHFTGMPHYDFNQEVRECRCYQVIGELVGYLENIEQNALTFIVPLTERLVNTPTLTNNVENNDTGIAVRNTQGQMISGFTFSVNYMFKNGVRVRASKNNHGLTKNDIGVLVLRGQSGFDSNNY